MTKAKSRSSDVRYEVITQEDSETGDIIIPIPIPLLKKLGWKEGDDIDIRVDDSGNLYLVKA